LKAAVALGDPHSFHVPAEAQAGAYWSDDRYGHFRNLAARCSTPAVPGMLACPPMETGGRLVTLVAMDSTSKSLAQINKVRGHAQSD
jgi:hypothetical protein